MSPAPVARLGSTLVPRRKNPPAPVEPCRAGLHERRVNEIIIEPLTAERFAPFGDVFTPPAEPGRLYFEDALATMRPGARPSLSLATKADVAALPLSVTQMERHEFSSQTFVPLQPAEILVIVAPHGADGGPDMDTARAFRSAGRTGITYAANVWHHPFTLLSGVPASFAIFMWRDGGPGDEEFVGVPHRLVRA